VEWLGAASIRGHDDSAGVLQLARDACLVRGRGDVQRGVARVDVVVDLAEEVLGRGLSGCADLCTRGREARLIGQ
jgi:hypothetical protein